MDLDKKRDILILFLLNNFCKNYNNKITLETLYNYLLDEHIVINNLEDIVNEKLNVGNLGNLGNLGRALVNINKSNINRIDNFDLYNKLGSGSYGNVVKCKSKTDDNFYALKIIKIKDKLDFEYIIRETQNMVLLNHSNIVRYYSSWINTIDPKLLYENKNKYLKNIETNSLELYNYNSYLFIQMELCSTTLKDYMNNRSNINIKTTFDFFKQILNGLKYLHKKNIIHRDLTPTNIYLDKYNNIKIGDFGMSINISSNNDKIKYASGDFGTYNYLAPETLESNIYSIFTDYYSLGIILFELLNIFNTEMEKIVSINNIKSGIVEKTFKIKYTKANKLILNLLSTKPTIRKKIISSYFKF